MIIKKSHLYGLLVYLVILTYLLLNDFDAFLLFLIFPLLSVGLLSLALRQKHLSLSIFTGLFFIGHGINPAFFFLNRDLYWHSGWNAVGGFQFDIVQFLSMYSHVYLLMLVIILSTYWFGGAATQLGKKKVKAFTSLTHDVNKKKGRNDATRHSYFLIFSVLVAMALNIFMFVNRIGMTGVTPPYYPFKLVGLLFYSRYILIPVVLGYLYMKSTRSPYLAALLISYAMLAGMSSISRSTLFISVIPVVLFALLDNQKARIIVTGIIIVSVYSIIQLERNIIYNPYGFGTGVLEMILSEEINVHFPAKDIMSFISFMSARLYGAQDIVLVSQYQLSDQFVSIIKYFSVKNVIPDLAGDLYGFILPEGAGVGIGLMSWMILLAQGDVVILILLGIIIAFLLFLSEKCVTMILKLRSQICLAGYPVAFFSILWLYSSDLWKFYLIISIAAFMIYAAVPFLKRVNTQIDHTTV